MLRREEELRRMIAEIHQDPEWLQEQAILKHMDELKGRRPQLPTEPSAYMETQLYKVLEPVLYKQGHQLIKDAVSQAQDNRGAIRSAKRAPFESESRDLYNYNMSMMRQAESVIEAAEVGSKHRKLSTLERNRLMLKFLRMNEKPTDYVVQNVYLERSGVVLPGDATSEEQDKKLLVISLDLVQLLELLQKQ